MVRGSVAEEMGNHRGGKRLHGVDSGAGRMVDVGSNASPNLGD